MSHKIKVIISMLIFGSLGVFVTQLNLPSSQIVFIRAAIGCLALFLVLVLSGKTKIKIPISTFVLLLVSGAFIGVNWLLLFESYRFTYISTATLLYYTQPVMVIILGAVILREKITSKKVVGVIAAIVGMILINGIDIGGADPKKGVVYALCAAVLYSCVVLINKCSKNIVKIDSLLSTDVQLLGAAVVMAIYTFSNYHGELSHISSKSLLILLLLGLVHTALAYYLYFSSVKHISAQSFAVLGYIDPASAIFFSMIFLNEKLLPMQWLGAVLILGGALFSQIEDK